MPLRAGDMTGDYRVLALIGTGGMGHVYKVQNILSNRIEAMKVVLPDKADELTERFLREIQVQASLVHPNITGLHTALRVEGQLIMIMELVDGETLKDRLEHGPLRIGECVEYGRQILDALAYAHRHHVVHRDIKPANIMLSNGGQAKLMDFGLASAGFDKRLTRSGTVMGSLYYMAPEQVKGQQLTSRSDLYSFGLTLYEMLTGVRGIQGDSDYAIMTAHLEKVPQAPILCNPAVPQFLSDMVLRAVSKDPAERFESAEAFRDALEQFARLAPEPELETTVPAASPEETVPADSSENAIQTSEVLYEAAAETRVPEPLPEPIPDVPTMTMVTPQSSPSVAPAEATALAAPVAFEPPVEATRTPSVPLAAPRTIPVDALAEIAEVSEAEREPLAESKNAAESSAPVDFPVAATPPPTPLPTRPQPVEQQAASGSPAPGPPRRKASGMMIAVGAAAAVVLASAGIYRFGTGSGTPTPESSPTESVATTQTPTSPRALATSQPNATPGSTSSASPNTARIPTRPDASPNRELPAVRVGESAKAPAKVDNAQSVLKQTLPPTAGSAVAAAKGAPSAGNASASTAPSRNVQAGSLASIPTPTPAVAAAPASALSVVEPPRAPQKSAEQLRAEEAARAWDLIASSNDPAVLRSFQSRYPQSLHAAEALGAAEKLETQAAAEAAARKASEANAALRQEVVAVLQRLELAYSARNMAQVHLAWPTMDSDHVTRLEQAFKDSRMVSLTLEPRADPRSTPAGAYVECRYVLAYPLKNAKGPRRMEGFAAVHLKRVNGALTVDDIEYQLSTRSLFKPL